MIRKYSKKDLDEWHKMYYLERERESVCVLIDLMFKIR